eukprot:TRINITY_DN51341_c0_g1_i1.p1 TRINITY_DN51341_c0_g1~~TRINITY_DN51341_c0_g1_i1.p1  ORF type:complete len:255 (+),score=39.58 TRINITY_DN51341_c0_g1_i1:67-765(+)
MAAASSCPLGYGRGASETPAAAERSAKPSEAPAAAAAASECPLGYAPSAAAPPAAASAAGAASSSSGVDSLSRERAVSTIPSSTGEPFLYPSERQFHGAATAKGHKVDTQDMSMVIAIHNAVNEQTWQEIMKYERLHIKECPTPRLERFLGMPGQLSPKARLLGYTGRTEPFDRHDWHVDRCGTRVRYLVDFYDGRPSPTHPISIHIDARPELTFGGLVDRFRLWAKDLNIF